MLGHLSSTMHEKGCTYLQCVLRYFPVEVAAFPAPRVQPASPEEDVQLTEVAEIEILFLCHVGNRLF